LKLSTKELLTPYNNNITKDEYLEIQSLSSEEDVNSKVTCIMNSTEKKKTGKNRYKQYTWRGVRDISIRRNLIY